MGRPFKLVPDPPPKYQAWVVLHQVPQLDGSSHLYIEGTFPDVTEACAACHRCVGSKAYVLQDQTRPAIPLGDQRYAVVEHRRDEDPMVVACYRTISEAMRHTPWSRSAMVVSVRHWWVLEGPGASRMLVWT